jgi:hypothetical protein
MAGLALAGAIVVAPSVARAQLFTGTPLRPPNDVPSIPPGPAQSITPLPANPGPVAMPKGPTLQSLPPAGNPGAQSQPAPGAAAGQATLTLSARFGRDLPSINGGLLWRVYRADQNGVPRLVKEDRGASPSFVLPPGSYVISAGFGLANVTRPLQLRAEKTVDLF